MPIQQVQLSTNGFRRKLTKMLFAITVPSLFFSPVISAYTLTQVGFNQTPPHLKQTLD